MRGGLTSLIACSVLALPIAGCGGGEAARAPPATSAITTAAPAHTQTQTEEVVKVDIVHGLAPNPWKQPTIRPHPHFKTDRVIVREIKKGSGPAVRVHDMVFVDFVEADYGRGLKFNGTWTHDPGSGMGLILTPTGSTRGLLAGIRGMRPGARRQIIAPPRLGGVLTAHADFGNYIYWDVVLRKILARGCSSDRHCRSIAP